MWPRHRELTTETSGGACYRAVGSQTRQVGWEQSKDNPNTGVCSKQRRKFVAIEKQDVVFSQIILEEVLLSELFSCMD